MADHGRRGERDHDEADGEGEDVGNARPEIEVDRPERRRVDERREEPEPDELRVEPDGRDPGHHPEHEPSDDEHARVGQPGQPGDAAEDGRDGEQAEGERDAFHGASSRLAPAKPRRERSHPVS